MNKRKAYKIPVEESKKLIEDAMNSGIIFGLECRAWGNRKKLSEDLAKKYFGSNDKEAINATQNLIDRMAVRPVTSPQSRARSIVTKAAKPWITEGVYFLDERDVEQVTKDVEECIAESEEALEVLLANYKKEEKKFAEKYPELYEAAKNSGSYPTRVELRNKFSMRYFRHYITPPVNGKVGILSKKEVEAERKKWENQIRETMEFAIGKTREALVEILSHLRDCLKDPDKKFKDSSVEKPKEFLRRLADIPTWGDKPLEKLANDAVDLLDGVYGEDLRDDGDYRKVIGEAVEEITQQFNDLPTVEMDRDLDI